MKHDITPAMIKSHAVIIWGGSETDRTDTAWQLAAAVLCSDAAQKPCRACRHCEKAFRHIHPDITVIDRSPDTRSIYVDQIRALREDAIILPNDAEKKVYIISHADSMNTAAQNALLKLLEEPPSSVHILLTAENTASLLGTVRSRCVELAAGGDDAPDLSGVRDIVDAFYTALSGGPLALISFSFSLEKLDRNKFIDFVDGVKTLLTEKLKDGLTAPGQAHSPEYLLRAIAVLDRAGDYFTANVGLGHISGMICAELMAAENKTAPPHSR